MKKFDFKTIINELDYKGINNYSHLENKFLITNTDLQINNFKKILSIDEISIDVIKNSLFFLYFETDDEYIYHLDKIINNNGKFVIHKNYNKYNYVYSNKNCKLALIDTLRRKNDISHYNEIIHGNICQALEQTKKLEGDYVEIGVYKGGSALTALNYMKHANIARKSYLFDTFDGFDYEEATNSAETHWEKNNEHHKLWGVDKTMNRINKILSEECPNQHFKLIKSNICKDDLPEDIKNIVVANIDVDLYDATRDAFIKVADKVVKGGIIIAEDPTSTPALIGAFYAMEKFLETPVGKKFMKLHLGGQYFLIKMEV
jgi:hypothetical protein